jgi:uncharacterized peroxidase-related enzyme
LRVENGRTELVEAIKEHRWREIELSARERALCEIAEKLSGSPTRMVEADWEPLRTLGFDDRGCLEVAHVVGLFNYLTRLADGLGLELDAATLDAAHTHTPLARPKPG